jgi:hypothetical protein
VPLKLNCCRQTVVGLGLLHFDPVKLPRRKKQNHLPRGAFAPSLEFCFQKLFFLVEAFDIHARSRAVVRADPYLDNVPAEISVFHPVFDVSGKIKVKAIPDHRENFRHSQPFSEHRLSAPEKFYKLLMPCVMTARTKCFEIFYAIIPLAPGKTALHFVVGVETFRQHPIAPFPQMSFAIFRALAFPTSEYGYDIAAAVPGSASFTNLAAIPKIAHALS